MAAVSRILKLPRLSLRRHTDAKTSGERALSSSASAARVQDGGSVPVERKDRSSSAPSQQQNSNRRARAAFPGLLNPFGQMSTSLFDMMDTMDCLFESSVLPSRGGSMAPRVFRDLNRRMPWDVMEDDKSFKLRVDMPGFSKEEVILNVEDGDLILKAEHKEDVKEDEWSARSSGSQYNIRINLPENLDVNGIKAEMKDGVLKVYAPKVEMKKEAHQVQIE